MMNDAAPIIPDESTHDNDESTYDNDEKFRDEPYTEIQIDNPSNQRQNANDAITSSEEHPAGGASLIERPADNSTVIPEEFRILARQRRLKFHSFAFMGWCIVFMLILVVLLGMGLIEEDDELGTTWIRVMFRELKDDHLAHAVLAMSPDGSRLAIGWVYEQHVRRHDILEVYEYSPYEESWDFRASFLLPDSKIHKIQMPSDSTIWVSLYQDTIHGPLFYTLQQFLLKDNMNRLELGDLSIDLDDAVTPFFPDISFEVSESKEDAIDQYWKSYNETIVTVSYPYFDRITGDAGHKVELHEIHFRNDLQLVERRLLWTETSATSPLSISLVGNYVGKAKGIDVVHPDAEATMQKEQEIAQIMIIPADRFEPVTFPIYGRIVFPTYPSFRNKLASIDTLKVITRVALDQTNSSHVAVLRYYYQEAYSETPISFLELHAYYQLSASSWAKQLLDRETETDTSWARLGSVIHVEEDCPLLSDIQLSFTAGRIAFMGTVADGRRGKDAAIVGVYELENDDKVNKANWYSITGSLRYFLEERNLFWAKSDAMTFRGDRLAMSIQEQQRRLNHKNQNVTTLQVKVFEMFDK